MRGLVKTAFDSGLYFGIPGFVLCVIAQLVLIVGSTGISQGIPIYSEWAYFWNNVLYPLGFSWVLVGWGVSISIVPAWWMHCRLSELEST